MPSGSATMSSLTIDAPLRRTSYWEFLSCEAFGEDGTDFGTSTTGPEAPRDGRGRDGERLARPARAAREACCRAAANGGCGGWVSRRSALVNVRTSLEDALFRLGGAR